MADSLLRHVSSFGQKNHPGYSSGSTADSFPGPNECPVNVLFLFGFRPAGTLCRKLFACELMFSDCAPFSLSAAASVLDEKGLRLLFRRPLSDHREAENPVVAPRAFRPACLRDESRTRLDLRAVLRSCASPQSGVPRLREGTRSRDFLSRVFLPGQSLRQRTNNIQKRSRP